ncbi:hypothetical protein F7725_027378 [Dissostichus mawsoni]|uniref:omega-amidase n=1 Tax=Dissostichus mawsoni TaxID=36200 RepID=A0A7J5XDN0_DISMA|nr:hypothetical protein F7725_027378 [Dissostichus mawsoni]
MAVVQLQVGGVKADNLSRAKRLVKEAAGRGGNLVLLPECFNSPYGTSFFSQYAERIPGESTELLSEAARENQVYLVGGGRGKLYNSCIVFGPDGKIILKHRKRSRQVMYIFQIHLFDIDVPGKIRFQEAVDNQLYVATASPARDESSSYVAWGHSTVVNPWGEVISKAGTEEEVIYADIDLQYLADVRQQIPITAQRRHDLYSVTSVQRGNS